MSQYMYIFFTFHIPKRSNGFAVQIKRALYPALYFVSAAAEAATYIYLP